MLYVLRLALVFHLVVCGLSLARADTAALVSSFRQNLEERLDPGEVSLLQQLGGADASALDLEGLGHAYFFKRHFAHAAWAYAAAYERDPSRAAPLSSLGVLLAENVSLQPGAPQDAAFLSGLVELQREARRLDGTSTAIANNLGAALTALGAMQADRAMIEEGALLIHEAVTANPQNVIFYVRLAEALNLMGETSAAAKFLEAAFLINSAHPTLVMSRSPKGSLAGLDFPISDNTMCVIDYGCDAKCPKSIIGQVDLVTCKIAESSAQSACSERKPFARFFDCSAKIPKFGILIPGLDPGFSILTPWGGIHAVMQGDGTVNFEVKLTAATMGPAQAALKAEGSFEPTRGDVALNFEGEAQLNLFNRVSPVMEQANAYDVGISVSEKYKVSEGKAELDISVGRGGILTD